MCLPGTNVVYELRCYPEMEPDFEESSDDSSVDFDFDLIEDSNSSSGYSTDDAHEQEVH